MARSIKKGPFVAESLLKQLAKKREEGSSSRGSLKTWSRASFITPDFVGATVAIHDGRKFVSVYILENMVGHRFGEFVPTRTFRLHSGQRKSGVQK